MKQEPREERELACDGRYGSGGDECGFDRKRDRCHIDAGGTAEAVVDVCGLALLGVVRRGDSSFGTGASLAALGIDRAERDVADVHAEIEPSHEQQEQRGDAIERARAKQGHASFTITRSSVGRNKAMHVTHELYKHAHSHR